MQAPRGVFKAVTFLKRGICAQVRVVCFLSRYFWAGAGRLGVALLLNTALNCRLMATANTGKVVSLVILMFGGGAATPDSHHRGERTAFPPRKVGGWADWTTATAPKAADTPNDAPAAVVIGFDFHNAIPCGFFWFARSPFSYRR